MTTPQYCPCPTPRPSANVPEVCGVCGKSIPPPPKGVMIGDAELSAALLEFDRIERELKTMGQRLNAVKAVLKSKLASQV